MTSKEKLAVINSMRIFDADICNGELVYAVVDYNEENIEKLAKVVPNVEEYIQTVGDPDGTKESIDISTAAFEHAGADYYRQGIFRNEEADISKIETLEAEIERLKAFTKVKKLTVYDNGIAEIHYMDHETMLINHVEYSDAYLTGWEDEDCFIKK